jgi:hypothetical protein
MRALTVTILAAIAGALSAIAPARAQEPVDTFQFQGWSGGAYLNPRTRTFSHCAVSSSYGGVMLTFMLAPNSDFRVEIGAEDWRLKSGGEYVATLIIDHHEPLQIIASARSDSSLAVELGADEDIIKELREGQFLRVLAEHIGISFSLSGSSQALLRLASCVAEHRGPASAAR